ncbi:hypothetical protein A3C87_01490 [Candidatus Kaiserbacteria bacterium RIFCSPHIGHO2_02_FULL_49_34]|uniref:Uncharacterized protein n=1 Tax=Candidatus Kaiserbacteria bacterium RIFCSPHIGHO2_02_FULL_49_34 TaxID=1798491 RepID=A0A1F6DJQ7_9BACT|nr:MAG: hypothetical protein A3C87_01490 [Candidatus Kaiserbacteria bacterium RIFCSPHIGHO2_02_FULL_49_34]
MSTKCAVSAASALLATNIYTYQEAILVLIEKSSNPRAVANALVRELLVYQESKHRLMDPNFRRVTFARAITYKYPQIDAANATELLDRLCHYGCYPSFVELCSILQQRTPTGAEIIALTEAYVGDKASRGEHDEEAFRALAKKYGDAATNAKVNALLAAFIDEWNNSPSY